MKKRHKILAISIPLSLLIVSLTSISVYLKFPKKPEHISLRLNWLPDPTFTGAYMAKFKGYWKELGLDVDIRPGGFLLDPIKLVAGGSDTFGITGADRLLFARAKDVPIKAIVVEFQKNPVGWIARKDSGIETPYDFVNHKVGEKFGTETEVIFDAIVSKLNIDKEKIDRIPIQYSLDPFLTSMVDVFPVYMNEEPFRVLDKGIDIKIINPSNFGVDLYGNVCITSEKTIKERPLLAQKFVEGLIKGWIYAYNSPLDATRILEENVKDMDINTISRVLHSSLNFVILPNGNVGPNPSVGRMDNDRWSQTKEILAKYGGLSPVIDIREAYTNEFVEQYYTK